MLYSFLMMCFLGKNGRRKTGWIILNLWVIMGKLRMGNLEFSLIGKEILVWVLWCLFLKAWRKILEDMLNSLLKWRITIQKNILDLIIKSHLSLNSRNASLIANRWSTLRKTPWQVTQNSYLNFSSCLKFKPKPQT